MTPFFIMPLLRGLGRLLRGGGRTANAAKKAGSGVAARQASGGTIPEEDRLAHEQGGGIENLLFRQLSRPRLTEGTAAELNLDQAREQMRFAENFYTLPFDLFARSDLFYEEVEEDYLNRALGFGERSIDERFLNIMTQFRRTLNDNTRRLLLFYAPVIILGVTALGVPFAPGLATIIHNGLGDAVSEALPNWLSSHTLAAFLAVAGFSFIGFLIALLTFTWPFQVVQQRNLLNLDNYITSKFGRINQNFQVAKRRALNVERNKRMGQADELKEEAGVWTLSYQWLALRLLLCEMSIRNKFYQVRRNTVLYWLTCISIATVTVMILLAAGFLTSTLSLSLILTVLTAYGVYLMFASMVHGWVSNKMLRDIGDNEWSRFHLVDLHKTIQDHVGEDKVQIVTFRDRNRLE